MFAAVGVELVMENRLENAGNCEQRFLVRGYRDGDENSINDLFNETFGVNRSLDEWHWKFFHNPAGFDPESIVLGELGGKLIGQYAGLQRRFQYRDQTVTAWQVLDNFVARSSRGNIHRLRGMYDRLIENAERHKCAVLFGFPMLRNYKLGQRLFGWEHVAFVKPLFRRLNWVGPIRRRVKSLPEWALSALSGLGAALTRISLALDGSHPRADIKIASVDEFDERFDALWNEKRHDFVLAGVRDCEYLTWRYFDMPQARYEVLEAVDQGGRLKGYVVLLEREENGARVGYLVDTLHSDIETWDCLVDAALRNFAARKVDYVLCWLTPGEAAQRLRERWGFATPPTFSAVPINFVCKTTVRPEDAASPTSWYLTYGDTDMI